MPITTAIASQFVNETRVLESSLTDASNFGGTTILVSGWAQLAVCILIVVLCCCCTLLCLCTSCICCSNTVEEEHGEVARVDLQSTAIISDKPPSYDEALKTGRNGLPSYQEALRRESQISWIHLPGVCNPTGHNVSSFHDRRHQNVNLSCETSISRSFDQCSTSTSTPRLPFPSFKNVFRISS